MSIFVKKWNIELIRDELNSVNGDPAPLFITAKFWAAVFKYDPKSLEEPASKREKNLFFGWRSYGDCFLG